MVRTLKPHRFILMSFLFLSALIIRAEEQSFVELRFSHIPGEVLHADSLVDETVYFNGYPTHRAEIDEFSVSRVVEVDPEGTAVLESSFRTVERVDGLPGYLEWIGSETVRLERDRTGILTVPEEAFLPVQRSIPRFPGSPVKPGDTWSLEGEEVHIFRIRNVLYGPYRGPVQARYEFLNTETVDGRSFARIAVEYDLYLPVRRAGEPVRLISGRSAQEILWDIGKGRPVLKTEEFEFMTVMSEGGVQEFLGTGKTTYRYTGMMDRAETAESLEKELREIPGIVVEPVREGILLSVTETDSILFEPESAVVSSDQRRRLEALARSLDAYEDRDILVTGYTADYGTAEGRALLSRERAAAVADLLFPGGRTGSGRLFLRGAGNSEPLGSDRADRRVEILILD